MLHRAASLLALPLLAQVGCLVVNQEPPPDPYGDIAFNWSFAGEPNCDLAGVDEIDIVILQAGSVVEVIERIPCVGGGLILTDFLAGTYEVEIDAFNRSSELLYAGGFVVRVDGGRQNDVGVVDLAALFDEPPPRTGDLAFFWSFLYPADEPTIDCALAGVTEVDIALDGPGGVQLTETFACGEDGAVFLGLEAGTWTLNLDAFGRYRNQDVHLYELSTTIDIVANRELDLGDLALVRDNANFADIQPTWTLPGTSCSEQGIADMRISIERAGLGTPEDTTTVACSAGTELRRTFVPGTYTVRLRGAGEFDDWVAAAEIDLAPSTLAVVEMTLAPLE